MGPRTGFRREGHSGSQGPSRPRPSPQALQGHTGVLQPKDPLQGLWSMVLRVTLHENLR